MICRFLLAALLLTGSAFAQTPPPVAATAPAAPPSVEAFASLPFVERAELSPVNAIAKIKAPLMLIHGKRDVTVDHVQSQKMFNAMTKADKAVEFVSLPLADHYFTREADRNKLLSSMEAFLAKHNPAS